VILKSVGKNSMDSGIIQISRKDTKMQDCKIQETKKSLKSRVVNGRRTQFIICDGKIQTKQVIEIWKGEKKSNQNSRLWILKSEKSPDKNRGL